MPLRPRGPWFERCARATGRAQREPYSKASRSSIWRVLCNGGRRKYERREGSRQGTHESAQHRERRKCPRCAPSEMILHDTRPSRPLSLHRTRPGEDPQTPVVWALWAAARQYKCCRLFRQTALIGAGVCIRHDFGAAHAAPLGGESRWCGRRFESATVPRVDFISKRRRSLVPQEECCLRGVYPGPIRRDPERGYLEGRRAAVSGVLSALARGGHRPAPRLARRRALSSQPRPRLLWLSVLLFIACNHGFVNR